MTERDITNSFNEAAIRTETPRLICIGGLSGSGKSTLARKLAETMPGAVHIDSDILRKELFGLKPTEKLGPEGYTREALGKSFIEMDKRIKASLDADKTVIVSAMHNWLPQRLEQQKIAEDRNCAFIGLWLSTDGDTLLARVAARKNDASDVGVDYAKIQIEKNKKPVADWPNIDAGMTPADILAEALKIIHGAAPAKPAPAAPKP